MPRRGERSVSRTPHRAGVAGGPFYDQEHLHEEITRIFRSMVDAQLLADGGDGRRGRGAAREAEQEWLSVFNPFRVYFTHIHMANGYAMQSFNLLYYNKVVHCIAAVLTGNAQHIVFSQERLVDELCAEAADEYHGGIRDKFVVCTHETIFRAIAGAVAYIRSALVEGGVPCLPLNFVQVKASTQSDPNDSTFRPSTVVHVYLPAYELHCSVVDACVGNVLSTFSENIKGLQTPEQLFFNVKACAVILAGIYHPWIIGGLGKDAPGSRFVGSHDAQTKKATFQEYLVDASMEIACRRLGLEDKRLFTLDGLVTDYENEGASNVRLGIISDVFDRAKALANRVRTKLPID